MAGRSTSNRTIPLVFAISLALVLALARSLALAMALVLARYLALALALALRAGMGRSCSLSDFIYLNEKELLLLKVSFPFDALLVESSEKVSGDLRGFL